MRSSLFPVPFWVLWFVELWERFGYYAISSILALFFINVLGNTEKQSIVTYGAFASFVYGFVYKTLEKVYYFLLSTVRILKQTQKNAYNFLQFHVNSNSFL